MYEEYLDLSALWIVGLGASVSSPSRLFHFPTSTQGGHQPASRYSPWTAPSYSLGTTIKLVLSRFWQAIFCGPGSLTERDPDMSATTSAAWNSNWENGKYRFYHSISRSILQMHSDKRSRTMERGSSWVKLKAPIYNGRAVTQTAGTTTAPSGCLQILHRIYISDGCTNYQTSTKWIRTTNPSTNSSAVHREDHALKLSSCCWSCRRFQDSLCHWLMKNLRKQPSASGTLCKFALPESRGCFHGSFEERHNWQANNSSCSSQYVNCTG